MTLLKDSESSSSLLITTKFKLQVTRVVVLFLCSFCAVYIYKKRCIWALMAANWSFDTGKKQTQSNELIWLTQIFVFGFSDALPGHPLPRGHQLWVSPRQRQEPDHWRVPCRLRSQGENNPRQCLVRGYDFLLGECTQTEVWAWIWALSETERRILYAPCCCWNSPQ